jgi:hypothetical protein
MLLLDKRSCKMLLLREDWILSLGRRETADDDVDLALLV